MKSDRHSSGAEVTTRNAAAPTRITANANSGATPIIGDDSLPRRCGDACPRASWRAGMAGRGAALPCSSRLSRSSTASASSEGAPWVIAACSRRLASPASPRLKAATPFWSSSSDSRCRSASALRARSMYARALAWLRIEEQGACPDVDRLLVLCGEVVVQTREQELLDLRIPIRSRRFLERMSWVVAKRFGHKMRFRSGGIIAPRLQISVCRSRLNGRF